MGLGSGADVLLTFVKEPRPGRVKSRLAAALGARGAAVVSRILAERVLARTRPRGDEYERWVLFDPPEAQAAMAAWLPGEILLPQTEGDLGARMGAAFDEAFRRRARRAVLIGTDVPAIDGEDVLEAIESLDSHDLAIGPAADGGYYLIALREPHPELFRGVAWSTPGVLEATLERAARLARGVRVLRTLRDVDTVEDLAAEWPRLGPLLPEDIRHEVGRGLGRTGGASES
jgi:rSAM/selenodomain-associated transferase 1